MATEPETNQPDTTNCALAKLAPLQKSQDVRRERASLEASPFEWRPVWNRTTLTSYYYNPVADKTRLGDIDSPGKYRIIHPGPTAVSSFVNNVGEGNVATMWQNYGVDVLMVVPRADIGRIRARIRSPAGWVTLQNLETNYRYAVKADVVIIISGVSGAPEVNGRYERDAHETDVNVPLPRLKQVNGKFYIRAYRAFPGKWIITSVRDGNVDGYVCCASLYYTDPLPITIDSVPPTWPAAWESVNGGLYGPMPSLSIIHANEGIVRKFPGKQFPVLGILRLDHQGYPPQAEEIESFAAMGYSVLYRCVQGLKPDIFDGNEKLDVEMERSVLGAVQRLVQMSAVGIVGDRSSMLLFQTLAAQHSLKPAFASPLLQWPTVSPAYGKEDRFLILTSDEKFLRQQARTIHKQCNLDFESDSRFSILDCGADSKLDAPVRGKAIPNEVIEEFVIKLILERLQTIADCKGIIAETCELLPYSDAIREKTCLPVWDAVTIGDFHYAARPEYKRFEVADWEARMFFEFGHKEGRQRPGPRRIGIIGIDYENDRVKKDRIFHASQDYTVHLRSVDTLTRYLTSLGKLTHACEREIQSTLEEHENNGVCAITGEVGFMISYQAFVRNHTKLPVFMTPLVMGNMVLASLPPAKVVIVLTADEKCMKEQKKILKQLCGFDLNDSRYVLVGCTECLSGCDLLAKKGIMDEMGVVVPLVSNFVANCLEEWPAMGIHIGAVLIECPQLLPCSELLRKETGLPVYDAITCCEFFCSARREYDRFGIKQWPYAWDLSIQEEACQADPV